MNKDNRISTKRTSTDGGYEAAKKKREDVLKEDVKESHQTKKQIHFVKLNWGKDLVGAAFLNAYDIKELLKGNVGIFDKENKERYIPKKMATYVDKKGKKDIGVDVFLEQLRYGIIYLSIEKFML